MSVKWSSIKNTVCIDNFIQQHINVILLDAPIMFHIILAERTTGASIDFKVCKRYGFLFFTYLYSIYDIARQSIKTFFLCTVNRSRRNKNNVPFTDFPLKIQTDIRTYRNTHKCHLRITARPDFGTIICIPYCPL